MPRDASSSVRAVVRVRPLLQQELEAGHENCCQASGDRSILVRVGAANQFRKYSFDACLPEDRSQKQVFQESGVTCLLDAAVAGYAATVLAYGQTGSGKTYTMMGRSSTGDRTSDCGDEVKRNDGLVIRAARRLFRQIGESTGGSRITVGASFAEIFNAPGAVNECICDLLNPDAGHLQVRFSQKHGFFISDLAVAECRTLADVRAVLEAGLQNRRVNAHALNRESSRTHALFTLHIDSEQADAAADAAPTIAKTYGKITFVDLAGSERLKESLSEGNARKETQAINKSLFTLGQVISQLSQGKAERHIPYRNSKLTQLLQDSFGGSALCLMVTCISPAAAFAEESVNSLNYAQKAMNIQNTPILQLDEHQRVLQELRSENANLRRELEGYRHRYGDLSSRGYLSDNVGTELPAESPSETSSPQEPKRELASRGHSLPPDFSPQVPRPPAPAPASTNLPSPVSARSGSGGTREARGSYAMAAVKRQQLRQPPSLPRPSRGHGKQLPPLPSRGSTPQSAPQSATAVSSSASQREPAQVQCVQSDTPSAWHSRRPSKPIRALPPSSPNSEESRHPESPGFPPTICAPPLSKAIRSHSRDDVASPLTAEQLEHLDRAHWSEWQMDFRTSTASNAVSRGSSRPAYPEDGLRRVSRTDSSSSSSSLSPASGAGSLAMPLAQLPEAPLRDEMDPTAIRDAEGDGTSTASETPVDKAAVGDDRYLSELNLKLASMQQATNALACE
ncbi:Kif12 [Symbiodinium sp. CCMP2456]|nr:Kif12 [Symbiodinium sp. CCMP2456]